MQTVSEALAALPKSRAMVGANKPSYAVSIEGLTAGVDWDSMGDTWRAPKAAIDAGGVSVGVKTNGKLIVCGMVGQTVYEGNVADVATLLGGDDTVTGWTSTSITTNYIGGCQVFRADDDLWLSVVQAGDADEICSCRLFKSASGNGGDWALYSTVFSHTSGGNVFVGSYQTSGEILVLPTGRYVLGTTEWELFSGFKQVRPVVYISDDKGLNWSKVYTIPGTGPTGTYYTGALSSQIARLPDGTLFWACGIEYGTLRLRVVRSDDNGATWSFVYDVIDGFDTNGGTLIVMDGELYFISGRYTFGDFCIGNLTQPKTDGTLEWVSRTLLNEKAGEPFFVVEVESKTVVSSGKFVLGFNDIVTNLPVKSINISRNKNMAASLELVIDNNNGDWAPDGTTHNEILWPNKQVTIEQGYGTEQVKTFTGLIDRIELNSFPQEIRLVCRDNLKLALDQLVTKAVTDGNTHILQYTAQTVEAIVTELAGLCGLTLSETIYTTGITLADITFSWCSYADAFSQLADIVGSADYGCDEEGKFYFRKDYIADSPVIAYTFKEGEDIISLGYVIDDADIFQKVVCYGTKVDGNSCFAQTLYTSRNYYNVLTDKYMKIDAGSSAQTAEQCQALTDRAEILMRSRVRICTFAAVAVPWLQVGDVIQVIETSTTISEAYRITDLSTSMGTDGYTMQITCYHHSYTE